MPNNGLNEIVEYRGVEGLVAAEVLTDDNGAAGYTTGEVFSIAGVAEISRTTDSSSEPHYYDNIPAIVISSTAADTVTISASAIPFDVFAKLTGQVYDEDTGALIECQRDVKYFALGYITKKTNGDKVYVWRYKGQFNIPDTTNTTENDSTDANGQELVYTGVATTHKFEKTGKGAKALNVDLGKDLANVSTFFNTVTTPDTLEAKNPPTTYTVTNSLTHCTNNNAAANVISGQPYAALITAESGYTLDTVTVTMGGTNITSTAVDGGAITVPSVSGNIVITATATN